MLINEWSPEWKIPVGHNMCGAVSIETNANSIAQFIIVAVNETTITLNV